MSTPSPAAVPARAKKTHLAGRIIRQKKPSGHPAVFVRPQPGWVFPGADTPECAVRLAVGSAWAALSRAEALRLADALVDTVEEIETEDPTEVRP